MLKRKMLRDIWDYKVQFISIFLMALIGMMVFAGIYVDFNSFEKSVDNYYDETNLADGWIYSDYLVDEFLYQVYRLGATTQMERQLVVDSQAILEHKPNIRLHFVENNTISKFYLIEGKELDLDDSEGVWLDKSFADSRNLKIGDEITFESEGIKITKKIRGFGYSPEYVYNMPVTTVQNYNSTGFAYMSHKAFPSENVPYNVLNVKYSGTPETYSQLLDHRLNGYYTEFVERSDHHSAFSVSESVSQEKSVSAIFPAMFILISMLMLLTTMKRIIMHQRTQIGVLKANGFKNKRINLHYLLPGSLLVIAGSFLGAIIGPHIFCMIAIPSRAYYFKLSPWNFFGFTDPLILVPVMGAIALLVTHYTIKNIINEPASQIMKPMAPKTSKLSFVEKLKGWNKLSFNIRWNFRTIYRNRSRSIMTVIGIIGCTVLLVSGLGLYEQINESKDWYFNDINHFESKLEIDNNASNSQINLIAQNVHGNPIMESSVELSNNKRMKEPLMVLDKTDLITITDDNHKKLEINDEEISVSKKLADRRGIKIGDTMDCRVVGSNKIVKIRIDKIHSSPFSQGLVMSPKKLEELGLNYTPTSIVTSQHVTESYEGITTVTYIDEMITGWDQMQETSMLVISALIFFAVLLSVVILYNLNMLSFTEMETDIATLKVLGFKSSYLEKMIATQSLVFIITGFIVGIPISYIVLSILMPAFGKNIYLKPSISLLNMAITLTIIVSVSVIMNIYFERKIKKLDMVDSLKEFER